MRIVVALGGNALLRRGEVLSAENQRRNVRIAAKALADIALHHELIISHGNGPQVGLLASQGAEYGTDVQYPLDVLGAETEGMIGYMIEQELGNVMPFEQPFATLLTMVEVDPRDPAFSNPVKPIGPLYSREEADCMVQKYDWTIGRDGQGWRRMIASPEPKRIFEIRPIRWLIEKGVIVICAGGGGIPTMYRQGERILQGAEVVIDKDRVSALLAESIQADLLILATDVQGVYINYGLKDAKKIDRIRVDEKENYQLNAGSMGPKLEAAIQFVTQTGKRAVIGDLTDLSQLVEGHCGTIVEP